MAPVGVSIQGGCGMRKALFVGAVGGIAAICGGVAASAASAATDITRAQTLHLVGTTVEFRSVQIGHSGGPPKLGDEFVIHDTLADRQGHAMGQDGIVCTFTSTQHHGLINCVATLSLPDGQITLQTLAPTGNRATFFAAVSGGTGNYQNARGEAEIRTAGATTFYTIFLIP
jgi:hypothetical protein